MIVPNDKRVIVKRLKVSDRIKSTGVLAAGQLKAGENLFVGEIAHPGSTKFKKGQVVYYSEYSAAALYDLREDKTLSEAMKEPFFVVAEDDVMAYDDKKVRRTAKKS